ncbi:24120_t:CDS:1, partial [Racocetra persica]
FSLYLTVISEVVVEDTIRVVIIVINRVFIYCLWCYVMSRHHWNCYKANTGAV